MESDRFDLFLFEVTGRFLGLGFTKDLGGKVEGALGDLPIEVVDVLGDRLQVVLERRLAGDGRVALEIGELPVLQGEQHHQGQQHGEHPGPQHAPAAENAALDRAQLRLGERGVAVVAQWRHRRLL